MEFKSYHSSSTGNLYQLDTLLIEAGVPINKIKKDLKFRLSKISGCLISHAHLDHAKSSRDLLKAGVEVYMSQDTSDTLGLKDHHRLHIIEPMQQFEIGGHTVLPFPLRHDVANMGFLISKENDKAMFAIDTNYIDYRFKDLTHILLGVNHDKDIIRNMVKDESLHYAIAQRSLKNHMSIQTAVKFFKANDLDKVKEIHLLHLSAGNSDAAAFKDTIQKVTGKPVYIGE